ncbi:hypothetical protein ABZX51_001603 [Aspergillus tubingensis]
MRSAAAVGDSLKCTLDTEYMAYSKNSIRILTAKYRTESSAAEGFPSQAIPSQAISAKTLLVSQATECPKQSKQSPGIPRVLTKFRRTDITIARGNYGEPATRM